MQSGAEGEDLPPLQKLQEVRALPQHDELEDIYQRNRAGDDEEVKNEGVRASHHSSWDVQDQDGEPECTDEREPEEKVSDMIEDPVAPRHGKGSCCQDGDGKAVKRKEQLGIKREHGFVDPVSLRVCYQGVTCAQEEVVTFERRLDAACAQARRCLK
mmetsp:Transcript_64778/g.141114  ORF Transcript_64778/g.141114 Transcript_64778/m.141114 type:complete len:157 (-) Transcript_64778:28-498(-)